MVEVFWAGQTKAGDWYLITEFIDGESLEEFVTGQRNLRDREALDVALDLLDALVSFHPDTEGRGLIHRDIKPRNVMLTRTGAKLLDFNIASRVGAPVHTQSGTPLISRPTPTSPSGTLPRTCSPSACCSTSCSATAATRTRMRCP